VQIITSPQPAAVVTRDATTGNAIGGIRLPQMAVPIETLTGIRPPGEAHRPLRESVPPAGNLIRFPAISGFFSLETE